MAFLLDGEAAPEGCDGCDAEVTRVSLARRGKTTELPAAETEVEGRPSRARGGDTR